VKVLISSIGSRGDVQPLLALATELKALGHTARLCAAPNFKAWVESYGIECVPLGPDLKQMTALGSSGPKKQKIDRAALREMVPQSVREQFQVLGEAAKGCDLIVAATLQAAARSISEVRKVPYASVTFSPITVPSPDHPPPFIRPQTLPRFVNRVLWRFTEWSWNRTFRAPVNEERAKLGLAPVANVMRHVSTEQPWVAADPVLAPGGNGAWFLPDPTPLPDDVERFLGEGDAPIYFGFGSRRAPQETSAFFLQAARALDRRVILLRGWADLSAAGAGRDCLVIGDVNHEQLLPRVAAIVHHGGAGTTHAAATLGARGAAAGAGAGALRPALLRAPGPDARHRHHLRPGGAGRGAARRPPHREGRRGAGRRHPDVPGRRPARGGAAGQFRDASQVGEEGGDLPAGQPSAAR
jgi:vancomycin aglycone glucosyltransferase